MADLDQQLDDVLLALEGFENLNEDLTIDLESRKELAQVMKWDLQPKAGISSVEEYIRRHRITPEMIISMDTTLRTDGMLTIVLVWGRVHPIIIAGPIGEKGDNGIPGKRGFRGLRAECECPEIIGSSSSGLLSSSTSGGSSSSSALSSSSSGIPLNYILDEFGDPILDEFGDPILDES